MHDANVDRTTSGTGVVHEMELAELQLLDAGLRERVPTFEEVLENIESPIFAEIKAVEAAKPLARLILEGNFAQRITPISFYPEMLHLVKLVLPEQPVGLLCWDASPKAVKRARSAGATLISVEASRLDLAKSQHLQRSGFEVTVWTVNEPNSMRKATMLELDGIVTDHPELLSRVLSS